MGNFKHKHPSEKLNVIVRFVLVTQSLECIVSVTPVMFGLAVITALTFIYTVSAKRRGTVNQYRPRRQKKHCRASSRENPYANPSLYEPMKRFEKPCASRERMDSLHNKQAFFNPTDVLKKDTGSRQFVSVPDNDQNKFANFLYNNGSNCREDSSKCTGASYR